MTTFFEREKSLRTVLKNLIKKGFSFQALSSEIGIHEKVIRDFTNIEERTLNPINYNSLVLYLNKSNYELSILSFADLVELLKLTTTESIKWDFINTFESDELKLYKEFRDFVLNDKFKFFKDGRLLNELDGEVIHLTEEPKENQVNWLEVGLRGVSNKQFFDDPFIRSTALIELKKKIFDVKYRDLQIFGFSVPEFLWNGDSKEIFLLMAKGKRENKIQLNPTEGLFDPKIKTKVPSSRKKVKK